MNYLCEIWTEELYNSYTTTAICCSSGVLGSSILYMYMGKVPCEVWNRASFCVSYIFTQINALSKALRVVLCLVVYAPPRHTSSYTLVIGVHGLAESPGEKSAYFSSCKQCELPLMLGGSAVLVKIVLANLLGQPHFPVEKAEKVV